MFNIFEKIFSYLSNLSLNKKNKKHEEEYKIRKRNIEILDEIVKEFPAIVEFKKIRFKTEFQGNLEYSIDTELFTYEFENKNFSGIENTLKREETELGSYNREYKNNSKELFYKLIKIKEVYEKFILEVNKYVKNK